MKILRINNQRLDFNKAQELAIKKAAEVLKSPMLISWCDCQTGRHFPDVNCCGCKDKPAWEIYAESRGARVRVEVGNDYVFIFAEGG